MQQYTRCSYDAFMMGSSRTARLFSPRVIARVVWGGMAILHAPILVLLCLSFLRDGFELGKIWSAISLAASLAFFVLKMRDVAFLHIRNTQAAWVSLALITALLHQGALTRHFGDDQTTPITWATVITITAAIGGRSSWRNRHAMRDWMRWMAGGFNILEALRAVGVTNTPTTWAPRAPRPFTETGPRAPPASFMN